MKQFEFSGQIKAHAINDYWYAPVLIQNDGLFIDIIQRFRAIKDLMGKPMAVEIHYSSQELKSKSDAVSKLVKSLYGDVDAEYSSSSYRYSSYTYGTDHDSILRIGGHDLLTQISSHEGEYCFIIVTFKD